MAEKKITPKDPVPAERSKEERRDPAAQRITKRRTKRFKAR